MFHEISCLNEILVVYLAIAVLYDHHQEDMQSD